MDFENFEKNVYHFLYVLVYAVLNHSLLGEFTGSFLIRRTYCVFSAMVFKFSYSKPPGRKMVSSFCYNEQMSTINNK